MSSLRARIAKMSNMKLKVISAACENMGIGFNNRLPWKLKNEMAYFTRMTTTTRSPNKRNAVILGRRTWDSVPPKFKPFSQRLNLVLSRHLDTVDSSYESVKVCTTLQEAIDVATADDSVESIWIIGGESVYKEAIDRPDCHKIYLTDIRKKYECDTHFPSIPDRFKLLEDHSEEFPSVPREKQIENDIEYYFRIYECTD